jgi:DNA polymerase III delta prime subunit
MALSNEQKQILSEIGKHLLTVLDEVARQARANLSGISSGQQSQALFVGTNTMVDGVSALRNLALIRSTDRDNLERLEREPFVARVVVRWEDEEPAREETLYISRASVAGMGGAMPDGKLASHLSTFGRLAEFRAGDSTTIRIDGRGHEVTIRERVRLRPERRDGQWDAVDDSFEFEPWRVALESVRRFLEQQGIPSEGIGEIPDLLGDLLRQATETELVRETLRRGVIEHIALRDQPILDQYQGEIFRLPLDRQLVLLGPPGTGKTTTLIRRLAQKRAPEELTGEELEVLAAALPGEASRYLNMWAMFSPTELLKLYLRDAFNREGIPAGAGNLKTWDKERLDLARNVLKILRSAESGRFRLDETAEPLFDTSGAGVRRLYEEFAPHFEAEVLNRVTDAYNQLRLSENEELRIRTAAAVGRRRGEGSLTVREISSLLEEASQLQPELRRLEEEIMRESHRITNKLLFDHKGLLEELIEALPSIIADERRDEDEDDEDEEDDEETNLPQAQDIRSEAERRQSAAKILLTALRSLAGATARGRSTVSGRAGRVIKFLGDRLPPPEALAELGARIVTRTRIRTLMRGARLFVMDAPKVYARFRRQAVKDGRLFKPDADGSARRRRISPGETDVLILTMLRNARKLLELSPSSLTQRSPHDWLEEIKSQYLAQVFVDEATDFSAVQLACTMELAHPRLRSWFACGDFDQRITSHGVRGNDEIEWLGGAGGDGVEVRKVNIAYRQSRRLRELAAALSTQRDGEDASLRAPDHGDGADVRPLLAEHHTGDRLASWLADRISEVERAVGKLPSIAVFVDGEDRIDLVVNLARPLLADNNISIVACKEGRVVGDIQEVRVFDVRHIKGLEFEAVFFIGIDGLAERLPDLFDRFFYVGVSRAATYLGVTCEGTLPAGLERVRGHFGLGGW